MEIIINLFEHHSRLSNSWMWLSFAAVIITMLILDLFIFHRRSTDPKLTFTLRICLAYMGIALLFGIFVIYEKGLETGLLYYTGYLVEFSLSLDNIFVISLVFTSLNIPRKYQHRVLFWGVLGAIVLRAAMIMLGESLISGFHWVLYLFSLFLIYTGAKMLAVEEDTSDFRTGRLFRLIESRFKVTHRLHGEKFFAEENGHMHITPLFFALIIVELMDVVFALDSIPAIFLITQDIFVVYTSNIFAILGLRSLYFLLAEAVSRFKYLKPALAIILIFIGVKIFLPRMGINITAWHSLAVTFLILSGGIAASLYKAKK